VIPAQNPASFGPRYASHGHENLPHAVMPLLGKKKAPKFGRSRNQDIEPVFELACQPVSHRLAFYLSAMCGIGRSYRMSILQHLYNLWISIVMVVSSLAAGTAIGKLAYALLH
jgi:hypothetical protein